jgi:hypothetical protein
LRERRRRSMDWKKDIEIVDRAGRRTVVTLEEIQMRLLMYLSKKEIRALILGLESTL